jgi:EAL domain-containing protein (putative c-di-GMP-specific phosphodiesterase class I)
VLRQLRSTGIAIAIDDFGVGYSSLNLLRRLPATTLKIDRTFVANCDTDERDDAVVSAIVNMAHSLGLVVVAEGVERPEQLQRLGERGCDRVQGFLFSRPRPAMELPALCAREVLTRLGSRD